MTGGAPTQQGAMQVYPATWSVTGQGGAQRPTLVAQWSSNVAPMNAPIAFFVRGSDDRLIVKLWHSQLSVFGGTNAVKQVGGSQSSTSYGAYEWPFPAIEDAPTSTNVSGTGTVPVTGNSMPIPSANSSGMATCKWQFSKGAITPPPSANASSEVASNATTAPLISGNAAGFASPPGGGNPSSSATAAAPGVARPVNLGGSVTRVAGAVNPSSSVGGAASGGTLGTAAGVPGGNTALAANDASGGNASGAGGTGDTNNSANESPAGNGSLANLPGAHPEMSSAALASQISTLPAPAGFRAQDMGDGSVRLSWQAVNGASQYRVDGPGIPAAGLYIPTGNSASKIVAPAAGGAISAVNATLGTRIKNAPLGPGTWHIGTVDSHNLSNPNLTASATAIIRAVPPHSAPWLTKNNGKGSEAFALGHYLSLCPVCVPGADFGAVVQALGVPTALTAAGNIFTADPQWADGQAARYTNATEFGTNRVTKCWTAIQGVRTVCYSNSGNHGLTVIVQQADATWFLAFASSGPMGEVLNWGGGAGLPISSNYKLVTQLTLDSEGPKYPPHACLACHGGTFNGNRVTGATLLPLDTGLLRIDDRSDTMAANFLDVNRTAAAYFPSAAVRRYLTGLYGGDPSAASGWGDLDYVPQGWRQQSDFYKAAVRPYCMMCHLATPSNLDFSTYGSFAQNKALISAEVCSGHTMPHAEYPFKQFWTKDTGNIFLPGYLAAGAGITSCQ
ncbi:MAG TPA: hypothetical protein VJO35_05975 [Terriglobales bacterium]|nr:hypothetical protein [Terriglobales bacterium]